MAPCWRAQRKHDHRMSPTGAKQKIAATPDMRTTEEKILEVATEAFDDKRRHNAGSINRILSSLTGSQSN